MRCKAAQEGITRTAQRSGSERASEGGEGLHVSAVVRKYKVQNHSDAAPGTLIVTGQGFSSWMMVLSRGSGSALCSFPLRAPLVPSSWCLAAGLKQKKKKKVDTS